MYLEQEGEKLSLNEIQRQARPFVDQNLQFQIPGRDRSLSEPERSPSPIYAHYRSCILPSSLEINERELYQAMHEAECSYNGWLRMQQQLQKFAPT